MIQTIVDGGDPPIFGPPANVGAYGNPAAAYGAPGAYPPYSGGYGGGYGGYPGYGIILCRSG